MKKLAIVCVITFLLGLTSYPAFAGPALRFDFQQDELPDPDNTEGLLLENQTVKIDVYLTGWDKPYNVSAADYYFTWDDTWLEIVDVTVITQDPWTEKWNVPSEDPGEFYLGVADLGEDGVPGPGIPADSQDKILLHTVELRGIEVPRGAIDIGATLYDPNDGNDGVIFGIGDNILQGEDVDNVQGKIHSICKTHSFKCTTTDPCDRYKAGFICSDDITEPDEDTYELIPPETTFCRGASVHVKHKSLATRQVSEVESIESMCNSQCFNQHFENYLYTEGGECVYQCIEEDETGFCNRIDTECLTVQEEVNANENTALLCETYYDWGEGVSHWNETCGLSFKNIPITVRVDTDSPDCQGQVKNDYPSIPELSGDGLGGIEISLPLTLSPGQYDICAEPAGGGRKLVQEVTITTDAGCPSSTCTIQIPKNPFIVSQGSESSLEVTLTSDVNGDHNIYLDRCLDEDCNIKMDLPDSLQLRSSVVNVTGGVGTIYLDTNSNPQTEDSQNYWANIIIRAESGAVSCDVKLDYEISAIAANEYCEWEDYFPQDGTVYGGRAIMHLTPAHTYPVYVIKQGSWNGVNIPNPCNEPTCIDTNFTTDANGDMECHTTLWENAWASSYPTSFDIVIDVGEDHVFVEGYDILDSFTLCVADDSDSDEVLDVTDNCLNEPNRDQEDIDFDSFGDTCDNCLDMSNGPDRGTCVITKAGMVVSYRAGDPKAFITCTSDADCTPTGGTCQLEQGDCNSNGCGDVCECYMDCNNSGVGDGKVIGSDLGVLKGEYGRFDCSPSDPCYSDGNEDGRVIGSDLGLLKNEYGRFDCPLSQ